MPWREQAGQQLARSRAGRRCGRSPASRAAAASAPRTTSRSTSGPEPAACERTSERCSWARISVGMCRVASAPKPVEMPYAGVGAAASSSTTARARSIAVTASAPRVTAAPSRATATTSSKETGPVPRETVGGHGSIQLPDRRPDSTGDAPASRIRDHPSGSRPLTPRGMTRVKNGQSGPFRHHPAPHYRGKRGREGGTHVRRVAFGRRPGGHARDRGRGAGARGHRCRAAPRSSTWPT